MSPKGFELFSFLGINPFSVYNKKLAQTKPLYLDWAKLKNKIELITYMRMDS